MSFESLIHRIPGLDGTCKDFPDAHPGGSVSYPGLGRGADFLKFSGPITHTYAGSPPQPPSLLPVKYDPPQAGDITVSESAGKVLLKWETPARQEGAEVQFRYRTPGSLWKLVSLFPRSRDNTGLSLGNFTSKSVSPSLHPSPLLPGLHSCPVCSLWSLFDTQISS